MIFRFALRADINRGGSVDQQGLNIIHSSGKAVVRLVEIGGLSVSQNYLQFGIFSCFARGNMREYGG